MRELNCMKFEKNKNDGYHMDAHVGALNHATDNFPHSRIILLSYVPTLEHNF